jgi:hypothetical protein
MISKKKYESLLKQIQLIKSKILSNKEHAKALKLKSKKSKSKNLSLGKVIEKDKILKGQLKLVKNALKNLDKEVGGTRKKVVKNTGKVQSILFGKSNWSVHEAENELSRLGFKLLEGKKVHVTGKTPITGFIRFRIKKPDYKKYNYRTIWFSIKDNIKAIYEYPKKMRETKKKIDTLNINERAT